MFKNVKKIDLLLEACEALTYLNISKSKLEDVETIVDEMLVMKTKLLYRRISSDRQLSQQAFYNLIHTLADLVEIVVKEGNQFEETEIIDEFLHEIYPLLKKYYSVYLEDSQE